MIDLTDGLLSPIVPYGQGLHNAGAGISSLADFMAEKQKREQDEAFRRDQMAQQGGIAAGQQRVAMAGQANQEAYRRDQMQLRQDALQQKAQQEKEQRVAHLRDMLATARAKGDISTINSINSELQRMGWTVSESDGAQPTPTEAALAPGGLVAAPKPTIALPDQVIGANDAGAPEEEETGLSTPEEMAAAQALSPGGLPTGGNPLRQKLDPEAQARLAQVVQQTGMPEDMILSMFKRESGLNPKAIGGDGRHTGMFQLQDGDKLLPPGKRLADLPAADQIDLYGKYATRSGPAPKNEVEMMVKQLAPAHSAHASEPDHVLYTPEQTAKWDDDTRKTNKSLLNADGSMTVASAARGSGITLGAKPDAISSASSSPTSDLLSPGGLPQAPRKGGRYEYRDDKNNLVDVYDSNAEQDRYKAAGRNAMKAFGYTGDPKQKAAADAAGEVYSQLIGTVGPEKALQAAEQIFRKGAGQKSPEQGGLNENQERLRLAGAGDDVRDVVQKVSGMEKYATIPTMESAIGNGMEMLKEGERTGLGDKTALAGLTKSLYGAAQSNAEFARTLQADGAFSRLEGMVNQITDGGKLPNGFVNDLRHILELNQRELNRRREDAARSAENLLEGSVLTMKPEEIAKARKTVRNAFTHEYDDASPSAAPAREPQRPTTGGAVAGAANDATQKALERARKLLGGQ